MAFGEILRNKRLKLGWTQEYISERTHMMCRTIEALETEDLKKIPAAIYGRGFIRQYCAVLGLDPQPLVEEYMAIVGGTVPHRPVTRPTVREIPAQPIAPIHTGGRKTLPPKEDEPAPGSHHPGHKLVTPAEDSFTAVPIPEDSRPWAGQPKETPVPEVGAKPLPEPTQGPEPTSEPEPEAEPPARPRDLFAPAPKRRREVQPTEAVQRYRSGTEAAPTGRPIFGPQHPVADPEESRLATVASIGKKAASGVASIFAKAKRPKVRRLSENAPTPLLTQRQLIKILLIFLTLVFLTVLVFGFRYVFRRTAAEQPPMDLGQEPAAAEVYTPTPVAAPPEPFFR